MNADEIQKRVRSAQKDSFQVLCCHAPTGEERQLHMEQRAPHFLGKTQLPLLHLTRRGINLLYLQYLSAKTSVNWSVENNSMFREAAGLVHRSFTSPKRREDFTGWQSQLACVRRNPIPSLNCGESRWTRVEVAFVALVYRSLKITARVRILLWIWIFFLVHHEKMSMFFSQSAVVEVQINLLSFSNYMYVTETQQQKRNLKIYFACQLFLIFLEKIEEHFCERNSTRRKVPHVYWMYNIFGGRWILILQFTRSNKFFLQARADTQALNCKSGPNLWVFDGNSLGLDERVHLLVTACVPSCLSGKRENWGEGCGNCDSINFADWTFRQSWWSSFSAAVRFVQIALWSRFRNPKLLIKKGNKRVYLLSEPPKNEELVFFAGSCLFAVSPTKFVERSLSGH